MNKIEGKFYPLKHHEWVETVKNLTGVEIKVLYYLRSLDPFGDLDLEYGVSEIATDLGVSKGAVSKALKKLEQLSFINAELIRVRIKVKLSHSALAVSRLVRAASPTGEGSGAGNCVSYRKREDTVGNDQVPQETAKHSRKQADTVGNSPVLEPLPDNGSELSKTNKTYSDFKNSLSDSERESFLNFGKKIAALLPNPPQLSQRWVEKNWEELVTQWYKSTGQTPREQNHKWETDPRCGDWLAIIEETANPLEFATDKEKQDFVRWCNETKQFSWLKGES